MREQITAAEGLEEPVEDKRILQEIKNLKSEIVTSKIRNRYWDFEPLIENLKLKLKRLAPQALALRHTLARLTNLAHRLRTSSCVVSLTTVAKWSNQDF